MTYAEQLMSCRRWRKNAHGIGIGIGIAIAIGDRLSRQFDLVLAGAGGVAVGMKRLAFSCLNNSSVLIQVIS